MCKWLQANNEKKDLKITKKNNNNNNKILSKNHRQIKTNFLRYRKKNYGIYKIVSNNIKIWVVVAEKKIWVNGMCWRMGINNNMMNIKNMFKIKFKSNLRRKNNCYNNLLRKNKIKNKLKNNKNSHNKIIRSLRPLTIFIKNIKNN